jgi:hypothetical protein
LSWHGLVRFLTINDRRFDPAAAPRVGLERRIAVEASTAGARQEPHARSERGTCANGGNGDGRHGRHGRQATPFEPGRSRMESRHSHSAGTPQPSSCSATRRTSRRGGGFCASGVLSPRWRRRCKRADRPGRPSRSSWPSSASSACGTASRSPGQGRPRDSDADPGRGWRIRRRTGSGAGPGRGCDRSSESATRADPGPRSFAPGRDSSSSGRARPFGHPGRRASSGRGDFGPAHSAQRSCFFFSQEGQKLRPRQEKAARTLRRHSEHHSRAKPCSSRPHLSCGPRDAA